MTLNFSLPASVLYLLLTPERGAYRCVTGVYHPAACPLLRAEPRSLCTRITAPVPERPSESAGAWEVGVRAPRPTLSFSALSPLDKIFSLILELGWHLESPNDPCPCPQQRWG